VHQNQCKLGKYAIILKICRGQTVSLKSIVLEVVDYKKFIVWLFFFRKWRSQLFAVFSCFDPQMGVRVKLEGCFWYPNSRPVKLI